MWRRFVRPTSLSPLTPLLACCVPSYKPPAHSGRHPTHRLNTVVHCSPKAASLTCTKCGETLPRNSFATRQIPRTTRICESCAAENVLANNQQHDGNYICTLCCESLPASQFATNQVHRSTRVCKNCRGTSSCEQLEPFLTCHRCGEAQPRESFSNASQHAGIHVCKGCTIIGRPQNSVERIDLGALTQECEHCGAKLFPCEGTSYYCGKYEWLYLFWLGGRNFQ